MMPDGDSGRLLTATHTPRRDASEEYREGRRNDVHRSDCIEVRTHMRLGRERSHPLLQQILGGTCCAPADL